MSDFTPGPWMLVNGAVYKQRGDHKMLVTIAHMDRAEHHTKPVERDANARLIAAAPDLLEALQEILHCRETNRYGADGCQGFHMAKEAIDKALGNK